MKLSLFIDIYCQINPRIYQIMVLNSITYNLKIRTEGVATFSMKKEGHHIVTSFKLSLLRQNTYECLYVTNNSVLTCC